MLAIAMMAFVAGTGCGETPSAETATTIGPPRRGGRLAVGVPIRGPEAVVHLTLEGLTAVAADGSVRPFLAESLEPNATYDKWTIRVRPGIVFHNGEPLNADALKANLDLFSTNPVYKSDPLAPIQSTTVVDERTVSVDLAAPWPSFPGMLSGEAASGVGLMVAPATIARSGVLFLVDPSKYADLFGTGPFIVDTSASTADRWVGRRNDKYWQPGLPLLDNVEIRAVSDSVLRASMLEKGDIDVAIGVEQPGEDLGSKGVIRAPAEPQRIAVALNLSRPPLDDQRLRDALSAATNVEAIADVVGIARSTISSGPYSTSSPWFAASPRAGPDPTRAKDLVAAYEREHGPVSVRLDSSELEAGDNAVPQLLAEQWRAVGFDVVVTTVDPIALNLNLVVKADFDAVVDYFFGMPDPDLNYHFWHSSATRSETKTTGTNFVGLNDPSLDRALDALRRSSDDADRKEANAQVQERLASQVPYVWLWDRSFVARTATGVRGLDAVPIPGGGTRVAIMGRRLNFETVWLDR